MDGCAGDYADHGQSQPGQGGDHSAGEGKRHGYSGVVHVHAIGDNVSLSHRRQGQHDVEPEIQLNQQGHVAEKLNIGQRQLGHHPVSRQPANTDEYSGQRRQDDADNGDHDGIDGGDSEGVEEGIRRFVGKEMLADGRLVGALQETEPVGDFPLVDGAGDVEEEPGHQENHQKARHNLRGPLYHLSVPPDRNALVGEILTHHSHGWIGVTVCIVRWPDFSVFRQSSPASEGATESEKG